ncbi:hypothetical protein JHD49_04345 [Sulfurimonas sp. SAG-AH-194-C21]|nr:PKD domain-containing protein [Sulfurimonas sp. SAG-AH-194-C21]MDF1883161.1 hypothetical protein [Sulfurimonas sp. SAG-AH-194-C21]
MKILLNTILSFFLILMFISCGSDTLDEVGTPNSVPVANAGNDYNGTVNILVQLDGSASSDTDINDTLTYSWSILSKATGSTTKIISPTISRPTFTPDVEGMYNIQLTVSDGKEINTDTLTILAQKALIKPIANAGINQNVNTLSTVALDGSSSSVETGKTLTYRWTMRSKPSSSKAVIVLSTRVNPTFKADLDGDYIVNLAVHDGTTTSEIDTVTVRASTVNSVPVADAGENQNIQGLTRVVLDGSKSSDANTGDLLTYSWSIVSRPTNSKIILSNSAVVNPNFTPDVIGEYRFSLIVNDTKVNSTKDNVLITVSELNSVPVANAGDNQSLSKFSTVSLSGSTSSDADGDVITYAWSFTTKPSESNATLSDKSIVNPSFIADIAGAYVISLVVNDSKIDSVADTVLINISNSNSKPIAEAGEDKNVLAGNNVVLDASKSFDVDSNSLTYMWSMVSRPEGSTAELSELNIVNPSFIVDIEGSYVFTLMVNDGNLSSDYDYISVNAAVKNIAPIAQAGDNQNVNRPTTIPKDTLVQLDGSLSSDANIKVDLLTYKWTLVSSPSGSLAQLSDSTIVNPTFNADKDGAYVIQLIAFDGELYSIPGYITVNAKTDNSTPVSDAGVDQVITTPSLVMLNGSASSDADGDILTYTWIVVSKPLNSTITLDDNTKVNPSFTADEDGAYTFQLVVSDGTVNSTASTTNVQISVNNSTPTARISTIANKIRVGDKVIVDGSKSSDVDGDSLTYSWNMVSVPRNSTVEYLSDLGNTSDFVPDKEGTYVVGLSVNDGTVDSVMMYVSITVNGVNIVPVANASVDQSLSLDANVSLSASASADANGDTLTYKWKMIANPVGSSAVLITDTSENPSFIGNPLGDYVFELIVNDGELDSAPDYVTIEIK